MFYSFLDDNISTAKRLYSLQYFFYLYQYIFGGNFPINWRAVRTWWEKDIGYLHLQWTCVPLFLFFTRQFLSFILWFLHLHTNLHQVFFSYLWTTRPSFWAFSWKPSTVWARAQDKRRWNGYWILSQWWLIMNGWLAVIQTNKSVCMIHFLLEEEEERDLFPMCNILHWSRSNRVQWWIPHLYIWTTFLYTNCTTP